MFRNIILFLALTQVSILSLASPIKSRLASVATDFSSPSDSRPFESEIEYIESTGTQWMEITAPSTIKRFVLRTQGTKRTNFMVYADLESESSYVSVRCEFSGVMAWNTFGVSESSWDGFYDVYVSNNGVYGFTVRNAVSDTLIGARHVGTVTYNGSIYLFGDYAQNNKSCIRLYSLKAYDNDNVLKDQTRLGGNLILDLVPMREGNVGCLFDRISQTKFYNQGTGSFVLGPDKQ